MIGFFTEISKYVNVLLVAVFAISGLYAVLNKKITRRAFGDFCAYQRVVILLFNLESAVLIFFNELGGGRTIEFLKDVRDCVGSLSCAVHYDEYPS